MRKMYLVNQEEYKQMKKDISPSTIEDSSDVRVAKAVDSFVRKRDERKIKENQDWEKLSSRLKPILSGSQKDVEEIIKQFPGDRRSDAQFILSILSRLPKVVLTPKRLLIDGMPMEDSLLTIIDDILKNNVKGVESLIQSLRKKRADEPVFIGDLLDSPSDDPPSLTSTLVDTPRKKRKLSVESIVSDAHEPIALIANHEPPKQATPKEIIKAKGRKLQELTGTTRTPKVRRSPVKLKTDLDIPSKKHVRGENFWVSY